MKLYAGWVALMLVSLLVRQGNAQSATAAKDAFVSDGYHLVWSDEFDGDRRPDPALWTYERGFVRNSELQFYRPENARCENGLLVIEALREARRDAKIRSAEYTSASVTTHRLHSWLYGRFVMRGRIPTRAGLWPAFWTLGVSGRWPANGEIDIMEYYQGKLLANAAWSKGKGTLPEWDDLKKPVSEFADPDWGSKFHIWRMDWDAQSIRLFVDDELLNEIELSKTIKRGSKGKNPFHQPHFIILNLAVGGTAGGDPSATEFPARFEVDYVRIYQKAGVGPR